MSKKPGAGVKTPVARSVANNAANMSNANKGSKGTNRTYDLNQGNRGTQIARSAKK